MDLFDRLRRLRLRIAAFSLLLGAVFVSGGILLFWIRDMALVGIIASVALVLILSFILLIGITVAHYKKLCRESLAETLLKDSFSGVSFHAKKGFSREEIENSGMILMGNEFLSAGLVTGERNGVLFKMSDVTVRHKIPTQNGYNLITFFDGSVMSFSFPKCFATTLQVKDKSFSSNQTLSPDRKRLSSYAVENREFNRFFRVMAEDCVKASYILTPKMLDEILTINYTLPGDLLFVFSENTLYVAVHGSKRTWDAILPHRVDYRVLKQKMLLDVMLINDFVDALHENSAVFESMQYSEEIHKETADLAETER